MWKYKKYFGPRRLAPRLHAGWTVAMYNAKPVTIYADSDSFIGRGDKEEPTQAYCQYVEECDDEGDKVI